MSDQEKKVYKILAVIIMLLIILTLLNLNQYIFAPLIGFVKAVFLPFILTGVLFYLFRPLVNWLERKKVNRIISVLLIYIVIGALLFGLIKTVGPTIRDQFVDFVENMPKMMTSVTDWIESMRNQQSTLPSVIQDAIPNMNEFGVQFQQSVGSIADSLMNVISGIGSAIIAIALVPFILFYALKDGSQLTPRIVKLAPPSYRKHMPSLLQELDQTIASYIVGQATVSLCVGVLLFIGYSIIGLDYALVLALIGLFLNLVPFLGPIIATIPALIVGIFQEPIMALYVIIVAIIAQQIEGNLISPQVMGHNLDIHPITVIILLVSAASMLGIIGIIFIVPAYALIKVFVEHGMKLYRIHKEHN